MFYQLIVLCCLCVLWRLWSKKQPASNPPELSGKLPIIGHTRKILGNGVKLYKSIREMAEECLQKGGLITFSLGPLKVYGVADPEDCLLISNKCVQKNTFYNFMEPYFGNGLSTADAATWKTNRKLLNPAFNQRVLEGFITVFNTQAQRLVDQFAAEIGKPFNHQRLLQMNSLETICTTSLGVGSSKYSDLQKQYLPQLTKVLELVNERIQKFWLYPDFIFNMTHRKNTQEVALKHVLALSKSIINDRKTERKETKNLNPEKFRPFVDLILDLAEDTGSFTDEQIREEIDTIIGAGHSTTSTLLTIVLSILGSRTDVQEKAYNEVLQILGTEKKNIEQEDLSKLVYIDAILKETLRLHPIVPIIGRRIDRDIELKNYTIAANSDIFYFIDGLHRHSMWGSDADQFRPERWLDKQTLPDTKYFGGFGIGKRSCIGKGHAMMLMKITLAYVLRNYHVSSDVTNMVLSVQMIIQPESGHYITLKHRNT